MISKDEFDQEVQSIVRQLLRLYKPQKVVLFGYLGPRRHQAGDGHRLVHRQERRPAARGGSNPGVGYLESGTGSPPISSSTRRRKLSNDCRWAIRSSKASWRKGEYSTMLPEGELKVSGTFSRRKIAQLLIGKGLIRAPGLAAYRWGKIKGAGRCIFRCDPSGRKSSVWRPPTGATWRATAISDSPSNSGGNPSGSVEYRESSASNASHRSRHRLCGAVTLNRYFRMSRTANIRSLPISTGTCH